jgi:hypothetical protein
LFALQVVSAGYLPAELIKMGNLYQHYMEHRQEGGDISLAMFIRLHYFDAKHEASDPNNHESLPLQQSGHILTVVFQSPVEAIHIGYAVAESMVNHAPRNEGSFAAGNPAAIFQPPRFS